MISVPGFRCYMFFGYFSGLGCIGSIILSIVVTLLLSLCFRMF